MPAMKKFYLGSILLSFLFFCVQSQAQLAVVKAGQDIEVCTGEQYRMDPYIECAGPIETVSSTIPHITCDDATLILSNQNSNVSIGPGEIYTIPDGSAFTNSVSINGGTLVVCGNLSPSALNLWAGELVIIGEANLKTVFINGGVLHNYGEINVFGDLTNNSGLINYGEINVDNTLLSNSYDFELKSGSSINTKNIVVNGGIQGPEESCAEISVSNSSIINNGFLTGNVFYCDNDGVETNWAMNAGGFNFTCDASSSFCVQDDNCQLSYFWSPTTGLSDPFAKRPVVTVDTTTTYTLRVVDQDNNVFEDEITVFVNLLEIGEDEKVCPGDVYSTYAKVGCNLGNSVCVSQDFVSEYDCENCGTTVTDPNGTYVVDQGQKLCITTPTFGGTIMINGGEVICCSQLNNATVMINSGLFVNNEDNGVLATLLMNNQSATFKNYGKSVTIQSAGFNSGSFENYGLMFINNDININGNAIFTNNGDLGFSKDVIVSGQFFNNGLINNTKLNALLSINSTGKFVNNCTVVFVGESAALNTYGDFENNGYMSIGDYEEGSNDDIIYKWFVNGVPQEPSDIPITIWPTTDNTPIDLVFTVQEGNVFDGFETILSDQKTVYYDAQDCEANQMHYKTNCVGAMAGGSFFSGHQIIVEGEAVINELSNGAIKADDGIVRPDDEIEYLILSHYGYFVPNAIGQLSWDQQVGSTSYENTTLTQGSYHVNGTTNFTGTITISGTEDDKFVFYADYLNFDQVDIKLTGGIEPQNIAFYSENLLHVSSDCNLKGLYSSKGDLICDGPVSGYKAMYAAGDLIFNTEPEDAGEVTVLYAPKHFQGQDPNKVCYGGPLYVGDNLVPNPNFELRQSDNYCSEFTENVLCYWKDLGFSRVILSQTCSFYSWATPNYEGQVVTRIRAFGSTRSYQYVKFDQPLEEGHYYLNYKTAWKTNNGSDQGISNFGGLLTDIKPVYDESLQFNDGVKIEGNTNQVLYDGKWYNVNAFAEVTDKNKRYLSIGNFDDESELNISAEGLPSDRDALLDAVSLFKLPEAGEYHIPVCIGQQFQVGQGVDPNTYNKDSNLVFEYEWTGDANFVDPNVFPAQATVTSSTVLQLKVTAKKEGQIVNEYLSDVVVPVNPYDIGFFTVDPIPCNEQSTFLVSFSVTNQSAIPNDQDINYRFSTQEGLEILPGGLYDNNFEGVITANDLQPGQTRLLLVNLRLDPTKIVSGAPIIVYMHIDNGCADEPIEGAVNVVLPEQDLNVVVTKEEMTNACLVPGTFIKYVVSVTNNGTQPINDILIGRGRFQDQLPLDYFLDLEQVDNNAYFKVVDFAVGETHSFEYQVEVEESYFPVDNMEVTVVSPVSDRTCAQTYYIDELKSGYDWEVEKEATILPVTSNYTGLDICPVDGTFDFSVKSKYLTAYNSIDFNLGTEENNVALISSSGLPETKTLLPNTQYAEGFDFEYYPQPEGNNPEATVCFNIDTIPVILNNEKEVCLLDENGDPFVFDADLRCEKVDFSCNCNGLFFEGDEDDGVVVPVTNNFNIYQGDYSFEFKLKTYQKNASIFSHIEYDNILNQYKGFNLYINASGQIGGNYYQGGQVYSFLATGAITDQELHHVAVVTSTQNTDRNILIYIDGTLSDDIMLGNTSVSMTASNAVIVLGNTPSEYITSIGVNTMDVSADELFLTDFRVWTWSLVPGAFNIFSPHTSTIKDLLKAYWKLEDCYSSTAVDYTDGGLFDGLLAGNLKGTSGYQTPVGFTGEVMHRPQWASSYATTSSKKAKLSPAIAAEGLKPVQITANPSMFEVETFVTIDLNGHNMASIELFDEMGKTHFKTVINENTTFTLGEDLVRGAYFLRVEIEDDIQLKKLVKL